MIDTVKLHFNSSQKSYEASLREENLSYKNKAVKSLESFSVDEKGFLGEDFNELANIPKDIKIHYKTALGVAEAALKRFNIIAPVFSLIDVAKSFGNAYNVLSQVLDKLGMSELRSFSKEDITKFPEAISFNENSLELDSLYDFKEYSSKQVDAKQDFIIASMFISPNSSAEQIRPYDRNILNSKLEQMNFNFDRGYSIYQKDGNINIAGVLTAFLHSHSQSFLEGETTIWGKIMGFGDESLEQRESLYKTASQPFLNPAILKPNIMSLSDEKEFLNEISRLKQENSKDDIRDNKKLKSIQEFFDEEFKRMRKQIEENAKRWHKLDLRA